MRLHGVRGLLLHQLGQHLDGGLVDGEVSGLDDGVEDPDHHLGREEPGHGGCTGLGRSDNLEDKHQ